MRCANRNKQPFWYAKFDETREDYDEYGNQTGTYPTYGKPVKAYGNISAAKGEIVARQFGDDDLYDKQIVLEERDTPIDEHTVLWIDDMPELDGECNLAVNDDGDALTPHNYIVSKVGRGLPVFGCTVLAVTKVSVT